MSTQKKPPKRRQHARATASDVARLAGVSTMTVSRVVNGNLGVREATRAAVLAAIDKLGYSPNKAARSLAMASQSRIGLIYTNPSSGYLSAMLLGVLEEARQSDTQVVVMEAESAPDARSVVEELIRGGIDGIMLTPPLADDEDLLHLLTEQGVEAVTLGTEHPEFGISSVRIDDRAAAAAVTRHIISLGHTRIAHIVGDTSHLSSGQRLAGFREAMQAVGLEVDDSLVVQGAYSYRSGMEAAERLLSLDDPPTAIFAANDDMAAATVATAQRHDVEVPGALTVCGFDDTLLATAMYPELTTIRQPITDMSHAAIDLLGRNIRSRLSGEEPEACQLRMDFHLVQRQSDGPPPVSARTRPPCRVS